ncbi:neprilysin-1-like [Dermacentor andersoni]|uniref:neprilysin-1-like n=1 Tax=Dermacentor andersoni TaxID=34620 RepID=UPI0021553014|nr:neprilysin-1-like [Dermacentor andersoni]
MSHGADITPDDRRVTEAPYSSRSEELSGSLSPQDPRCTTVQTRSRTQILVARSPSRLPYMAVCSVGLLMVAVGVAVTTYKLHAGDAIMDLFNRSMELLRRGSNGSVSSGGDENILAGADASYLVKHKRKVLGTQSTCKGDVCLWAESYLRGRLNSTVNPCTDFYAHVCSRHWTALDLDVQSRAYRERAAGMMMTDIEKFFRDYLKENEDHYHKYPGVFLHQAISLLPKCESEEKSDKNFTTLRSLLAEYNLGSWPYKKAPRGANIVTVSAYVDRDLGVFPFARVFLRRPFEDDRGYTVHIDAPSLTMRRYNLAYLDEAPENFTRKVATALSLFDQKQNVSEQVEAIVHLEKRLHSIMGAPHFIEFQDRTKRVGQLDHTGKWDWKDYFAILFQDIETFRNDKPVALMNHEYISKLSAIINETDTVTLLNYVGYRLVVHLSPLLAKAASPLLRLSHDDYLESIPDRRQACMHLLERLYRHGMRFFGRMTFSKSNSTLLFKHYDYSLSGLEVQLKSSMTDRLLSSSSWLDRSAIGIGVDKIENMRFVFLGSTDDINTIASYYNFNAPPLDPSHLIGSFRELQASTMNTYWETKPPNDDLDARYDHTALSPGHEYFFGRNVLFIPHANIAFLNDISKSIEPILFPLILAEIFRGMFGAVDRRGATVDHNLAVATWWNADEMSKFSQLELCFQDQYYVEIRDLIGDNFEARLRLEENLADNAIMGPLHDMYMKVLMSQDGADRLKITVDDRQLDMEQLFFILYAVGLCDNPNRDAWMRKLKFGDIPGRLRVNIPLMNFAKFSAAFGCAASMPMNPTRKCTIW